MSLPSINSVTGRGPEGTADGVAIGNPLPDWMADGQERRRTAVSVVATRVRKGSENGRFGGSLCTPVGPEKPENPRKIRISGNPRDPPGKRPSQNQALRSVPTGRVIKYPRKCTPPPGGVPRGPPRHFSDPNPGSPGNSVSGPLWDPRYNAVSLRSGKLSATRSMMLTGEERRG